MGRKVSAGRRGSRDTPGVPSARPRLPAGTALALPTPSPPLPAPAKRDPEVKPPGSQPSAAAAPRPSGHCSEVGAPRAPERSFETGEGRGTRARTNWGTSGGVARSSRNGRWVALKPRGWTRSGFPLSANPRLLRAPALPARRCARKDSRWQVAADTRKGPGTDGAYLGPRPAMFNQRRVVSSCVVAQAELAARGQPWTPDHLVGGTPACMRSPTPTWSHQSEASF